MRARDSDRAGTPTPMAGADAGDPGLFPAQNPHPVLRIADGRLVYANPAAVDVAAALELAVGQPVSPAWLARLEAAAHSDPPESIEIALGVRTMSLLVVHVPGHGFLHVYGTDVTAARAVDKFPDSNPNPVLRMTEGGVLAYANRASRTIVAALGIGIGDPVPEPLQSRVRASCAAGGSIEVQGDGRIFELRPVRIAEFGFINLYGTDVTAARALNKFPDQNPNPVLRVSPDGRLEYANPASELVCRGLGLRVGEVLPPALLERVRALASAGDPTPIEVESNGRQFHVKVVSVFEFGSINLYGTDITAARLVEQANRENERLLLNILPPSIATRLRGGEVVIADRFDEMAVLFADVVDFTKWAATAEATDVVAVLNEVFSLFDRLADRHGLEKIKTIGDAYMAVGGIDPESGSGIERVAAMAVELLDELERYRANGGYDLHVRIGIASGPTVAGVIGLKKFIYDVWGDTVNLASRLESSGVADRIQVTSELGSRLSARFQVEPRGLTELKGRGAVETCFVVGRRDEVGAA